jgi:amyloid beta precursor protein binding protein 1
MASNRVPTPPPFHDLPTAKEKKYDRQLRLWGASGQAALEKTHILLVNNGSGVTGIEALKNLVLPGIGQFSILDPAIVTEADLGVNFFLEELNPDAKGTAVKEVSKAMLVWFHALARQC